jgi:hypothetical protein
MAGQSSAATGGPATSSRTGTFYFAYGSNLSVSQMRIRLSHDEGSSVPVAVARLDGHRWIICERGYANVVRTEPLPKAEAAEHENTTADGDTTTTASGSGDDVVWGLIYNMSAEDEARLDLYEGHNTTRNPTPELNEDPATKDVREYLQGGWDYNKHHLPMTVAKWLRDPNEYGINTSDARVIRALVYVDEFRTVPGRIVREYIGRMNRGIDESVALGVPQSWVDRVMRPFIPANILSREGYVGTDRGYVEGEDEVYEAEPTETAQHHLTQQDVQELDKLDRPR